MVAVTIQRKNHGIGEETSLGGKNVSRILLEFLTCGSVNH
jgi:hypothetical protein